MSNETQEKEIITNTTTTPMDAPVSVVAPTLDVSKKFEKKTPFGNRRGGHGGGKRGGGREERSREFEQKILSIRRVTRVASGGRRFSFSVAMVLGNKKGSVGVGTGKAGDTALAIEKATRSAKKAMVKLNLTKTLSIPHRVEAKYSSARIMFMPAPGKGLIAGSAARDVLVLAGVHDVVAKIFSGSKNRLNIAQVAIKALATLNLEKKLVHNVYVKKEKEAVK